MSSTPRTPGTWRGGSRDALASAVSGGSHGETAGEFALAIGLIVSMLSMTTAMAQIERGTSRIYGIRRDRTALANYGRALVLTAVLALPVGVGFLMLVAGGSFAETMRASYGWSDITADIWNAARWPVGLALLLRALLSSIALFAGAAVCAQLELLRAGESEPVHDDPGPPPHQVVQG